MFLLTILLLTRIPLAVSIQPLDIPKFFLAPMNKSMIYGKYLSDKTTQPKQDGDHFGFAISGDGEELHIVVTLSVLKPNCYEYLPSLPFLREWDHVLWPSASSDFQMFISSDSKTYHSVFVRVSWNFELQTHHLVQNEIALLVSYLSGNWLIREYLEGNKSSLLIYERVSGEEIGQIRLTTYAYMKYFLPLNEPIFARPETNMKFFKDNFCSRYGYTNPKEVPFTPFQLLIGIVTLVILIVICFIVRKFTYMNRIYPIPN